MMCQCIVWACEYGTWEVGVDASYGGKLAKKNVKKLVKRKTKEKKHTLGLNNASRCCLGP